MSDTKTENRLTESDRLTIKGRLSETVTGWGPHAPSYSDVGALERVGHHAIGCTAHDLRLSEITEIREAAITALGLSVEEWYA